MTPREPFCDPLSEGPSGLLAFSLFVVFTILPFQNFRTFLIWSQFGYHYFAHEEIEAPRILRYLPRVGQKTNSTLLVTAF